MNADRNLLFGIVALQLNFITQDALIGAMQAWFLDKQRTLGDILRDQRALASADLELLNLLVDRQVRQHGTPEQSLAALDLSSNLRRTLSALAEGDSVGQTREPVATLKAETVLDPSGRPVPTTLPFAENSGPGARYRRLRPHARGGLGEVFVAEDLELHREVALKEIQERHAHQPASRARFILEAEITGRLEHPGIVPVYGLGVYADGRPFYAMRFIRGEDLQSAIQRFHASPSAADSTQAPDAAARFQSLEFRKLLGRFIDVCNAVAYAHSRGILHRDLKPSNIMLGKYGETLVVDWGLAKAMGRAGNDAPRDPGSDEATLLPSSGSDLAATVAGSAIGTPGFMSPEQAAGKVNELGPATDIYGLGATLYGLLTNHAPVSGVDAGDILRKVQSGDWPRPRSRNPAIPVALEAICTAAMARRPADRYPTALALAEDVEHWLADEPVTVHRDSAMVRTRRWMRKHRVMVASAAATALLTLVGLAAGLLIVAGFNQRLEAANVDLRSANTKLDRARADALASEATAKERSTETEAVLEFVEKRIFAAARPQNLEGGLGRTVTLRQAVEAALPDVMQRFAKQPLIEARLRNTLGVSFLHLGEAKIAAEQFRAAHDLLRHQRGPDYQDTLKSANNLAISLGDLGQLKQSLKLTEETLAARQTLLGPKHPDTLLSMHNLANCLFSLGRYTDALKLREQTLAVQKAELGPDHADTLGTMLNLSNSYRAVGRYRDAFRLAQETLQLQEAKQSPHHPDTLRCQSNLAKCYYAIGQPVDAARVLEGVLEQVRATFGPDHRLTLAVTNDLGLIYNAIGRRDEALALSQQTLERRTAKLGPTHPDTLNSMNNVAGCLAGLKRFADAIKLREEALELQKVAFGPDHPDTFFMMNDLAKSYLGAGRSEDAVKLHAETLKARQAILGVDHPETLESMNNLANAYTEVNKRTEALALYEETLRKRKELLGLVHPSTLMSMNNLALCYDALSRGSDALELQQQTLALRQANLGPDHADTLLSMWSVIVCLAKLDRSAEAIPIIDDCVNLAAGKAVGPQLLPIVMDVRLRHFEKTKDAAGCRATAEMWERLQPTKAAGSITAGRMRAVTAAVVRQDPKTPAADADRLAKVETDLAMAWLKEAVAAGYRDLKQLKESKDLSPLRDREDFKKLLADLEGATKPASKP